MEPYIELRPVMTIKTEALVAPLECSVPTIQDIQRIESFFSLTGLLELTSFFTIFCCDVLTIILPRLRGVAVAVELSPDIG